MSENYLRILQTSEVEAAKLESYGRSYALGAAGEGSDRLGSSEISFIEDRDSFYLGSIGESGWSYVQHRGGERGFLKVLGPGRLAFADLDGNRQLISAGNFRSASKISLF